MAPAAAAARAPSRRAARAASRREARADAAKAAVRRFLDDEASGGDDDEDDAEDWCTDDEAFIAPTQDAGDAEDCDAYRLLANARAIRDDGDLDDSGGRRRVLAAFGPRTARDVRDTPSPSLPPGQTPVASQYGGSFIDDDEYEAEDGGW